MNCKTLFAGLAIMMAAAPTTWAQAQTENTNTATATVAEDDDAKYATALLKPGTQAPDFKLSTADGKTLSLSELKGRYVVLDFWASWCPDCRRDLPHMVRMQQTYGPRGVQFVGVSFDEKKENLLKAVADYKLEYPQVSEWKKWKTTTISKAYCINWIPSVYLIDPEGKVVLSTVMSDKIEAALAQIFPSCCEQGAASEKLDCCKKAEGCCKEKQTCKKAKEGCKKAKEGCNKTKDNCCKAKQTCNK